MKYSIKKPVVLATINELSLAKGNGKFLSSIKKLILSIRDQTLKGIEVAGKNEQEIISLIPDNVIITISGSEWDILEKFIKDKYEDEMEMRQFEAIDAIADSFKIELTSIEDVFEEGEEVAK